MTTTEAVGHCVFRGMIQWVMSEVTVVERKESVVRHRHRRNDMLFEVHTSPRCRAPPQSFYRRHSTTFNHGILVRVAVAGVSSLPKGFSRELV